jgi:hypothetical protein
MIKCLQDLVYWVNNHTLHQQPITAADFTVEQMNSAMSDTIYQKSMPVGQICPLRT